MTAAYSTYPVSASVPSVLIATPNSALRKRLSGTLSKVTHVTEAVSGAQAMTLLEQRGARIVVLDRVLPDLNSEDLIGAIEQQFAGTDVILLDGERGCIEMPEDMRGNSVYELLSSFARPDCDSDDDLRDNPADPVDSPDHFRPLPGMIGQSEAMQQVSELIRVVARHTTSVLLTGETGAGKELAAEAIHTLSSRADKPFITINCAAIPEALVEAELFGHTRGAFTGAVQARLGKIHSAHGGTIFFDEIGELPLASQSKLLRFLERGEVQRLGTSDVFRLDVRVVAATNLDLEERVAHGLFREDLFYRLAIFPIELPPLRSREGDVALLASYFLRRFSGGGKTPELSLNAEAKLRDYAWPGNVRELRNVIERACILADGAAVIKPEHIVLRRTPALTKFRSEIS